MVFDAVSEKPKLRRGRPPKARSERKNTHLTIRLRDGLREQIAASAQIRDASQSEEVERRVRESFENEAIVARLDRIESILLRAFPQHEERLIGDGDFVRFEQGNGYTIHRADGTTEKF